jgi:hypothetical protein
MKISPGPIYNSFVLTSYYCSFLLNNYILGVLSPAQNLSSDSAKSRPSASHSTALSELYHHISNCNQSTYGGNEKWEDREQYDYPSSLAFDSIHNKRHQSSGKLTDNKPGHHPEPLHEGTALQFKSSKRAYYAVGCKDNQKD